MRVLRAIVASLALSVLAAATPYADAQQTPVGGQSGVMAQVASSGHVYIAQPISNAIFIRDSSLSLLAVLQVPATPAALAVDTARRRVYVTSDTAGMISVIDDRTLRLIHIYAVGGHPDGLALLNKGKTLLVSDGVSGAIQSFAPLAAASQPRALFTIGPAAAPSVELAPQSAAMGAQALAWARGFSPGEPVEVYWVSWGTRPLARVQANPAGIVTAQFQVPSGIALGQHLVILYGRWSTTSESGLLTVLRARPIPRRVRRVVKAHPPTLWQRLLAPSFTLPFALGDTSQPRHSHGAHATAPPPARMRLPAVYVAAVLPPLLGVIVLRGRRRIKARKARKATTGKKAAKGRGGARASPPLKRAS